MYEILKIVIVVIIVAIGLTPFDHKLKTLLYEISPVLVGVTIGIILALTVMSLQKG